MVDIKVRIETGLTWEEDDLLSRIKTILYKEVGGGVVTLYAEHTNDILTIPLDIQKVRGQAEYIRGLLSGH